MTRLPFLTAALLALFSLPTRAQTVMNHDGMNMQGGATQVSPRDPHAYADGFTLTTGQYAQPGPRQLRLGDEEAFGTLRVDRVERVYARHADATAWDVQARFGRDYDRLIFKSEGDYTAGRVEAARNELLWAHALTSFWDTQLGVRHDSGEGPDRSWLAFGAQGLAPYWVDVDATVYLGSHGRTALRLSAEYDLRITQRLILQPRAEIDLRGKRDTAARTGSGLNETTAGLRLRYEISRRIAPYVGVEWQNNYGQTARLARESGSPARATRYLVGVNIWF